MGQMKKQWGWKSSIWAKVLSEVVEQDRVQKAENFQSERQNVVLQAYITTEIGTVIAFKPVVPFNEILANLFLALTFSPTSLKNTEVQKIV